LADWRRRVGELYAAARSAGIPHSGWVLWRAGRDELFRSHPQSPVLDGRFAHHRDLPFFDYDPKFRFIVRTTQIEPGPEHNIELPEGTLRMRPAIYTQGLEKVLGRELTVYWIEGYGGGLFLPFRDGTSGAETYGGGRYLIDTIKGADLGAAAGGRLI